MECAGLIVLDTHVMIWLLQADDRLGEAARKTIVQEAAENAVLVPAICVWEIALAVNRDQLNLPHEVGDWIHKALTGKGIRIAPLEPEVAIDTARMPWDHKDPADRMIVATARHWKAPLMTADHKILAYGESGQVKVVDARA